MPPHGRRRVSALLSFLAILFTLFGTTLAASSVLGLDIGTEYLKAALVKPGIPLEIVLTKDSKRKEAAAVAFKPGSSPSDSSQDLFPVRAYGSDALAIAARYPSDVFSNLKPLVGLEAAGNPAAIAHFQARYPNIDVQTCKERGTTCLKSGTFAPGEQAFSVEELLAMELQNIRANAEAFAGKGSVVKDVVISLPAYYSAEEKRAVKTAAELAGLNILAFVSDGLAVGLNYATSRTFPTVNEGGKPEYHLVYDMGAGSTTATVMKFQGRVVKDVGKFNKTIQEVQVLGVGWDKTLGGDALNDLIMSDMITKLAAVPKIKALGTNVDEIKNHGKTVAKLWKETERVRQVLSANTETQASFEGIFHEDVNFKYKITRTEFEKMANAHVERVKSPITQALAMAKLEIGDVESVILHGGAVRTPFVQKVLEGAAGKAEKLRTNVNSDEAAAFGAAFKAAGLSPSFRVKEIRASDAAIFPVTLSWISEGKERQQKIFVPSSLAGAPKQIPFKLLEDFSFTLSQDGADPVGELKTIPVSTIQTTNLTKSVQELKEKYGCEDSAISTHFSIQLSPATGLPQVTHGSVSCEALVDVDKKAGVVDGVKGLFGFGKKEGQEVIKDKKKKKDGKATLPDPLEEEEESFTSTAAPTEAETKMSAEKATETPKAPEKKKISIRVGVSTEPTSLHKPSATELSSMKDRMKGFDRSDKDRKLREEALNNLEGYTYKVRDIIEDEGFVGASTKEIRALIQEKSAAASEWIYGDGADAKLDVLRDRLTELQNIVTPVHKRMEEAAQRPDKIQALRDAISQTKSLWETLKAASDQAIVASAAAAEAASSPSASVEAEPSTAKPPSSESPSSAGGLDDLDDDPFSAIVGEQQGSSAESGAAKAPDMQTLSPEELVEISSSFEETEKWLDDKVAAQDKLAATNDPVLLVQDINNHLEKLNKLVFASIAKLQPPQPPSEEKKNKKDKAKDKKTKTKSAKSTATQSTTASAPSEKASDTAGKGKGKAKDEL